MKNIIILSLLLFPFIACAQYPATGNKQRLGYQTTGDGLIWRGVAADTVIKPRTTANAYFQLDTVNAVLYRYIATQGRWQEVGGGTGLTMPFDSITFTPSLVEPDTAELKYSADLETFVFGADGTTIEIGQKEAWYVKNQSGGTIPKGTVVRAVGTLGSSGRILIDSMIADGSVLSKYLLGITASDIPNGSDGYVIHFGKLRQFNTSAWNDGDVLWADPNNPGKMTNVEPTAPDLKLPLAFVVHDHASTGVLAVRVETGLKLNDVHDVDTAGVVEKGVLRWDDATGVWKSSTSAAIVAGDTAAMLAPYFLARGGTLTGTGGNGFINFPLQSSPPATPATGFSLYAGSTGNNISWMQPDGFSRRLVSPVTGTPRQYQFMARSYTLADSADVASNVTSIAANYIATSNGTNLVARNLFDNDTYAGVLNSKPFQFGQWTTPGRPSGTTGYTGYNTTTNFTEGYFTSQWENYITSIGALSGYVPYFISAGKVAGSSNFSWDNTNQSLSITGKNSTSNNIFSAVSAVSGYVGQTFSVNAYGGMLATLVSDADNTAIAASLIGDTRARIALGLDTGVPFLSFGNGSSARDISMRRDGAGYVNFTSSDPADGFGQIRITNSGAAANNTGISVLPSNFSNAILRLRTATSGAALPIILLEDGSSGDARIMLDRATSPVHGARNDLLIINNLAGKDIIFANKETSTTAVKAVIKSTGNLLLGTTTDVPTSILTARSTTKSSSPFPLHTLAESDAITGVQGNFDYETTQNGLRWYNGTRKAYALESTFARGTATRVPFFDANGQVTDNAGIKYETSSLVINRGSTAISSTERPALQVSSSGYPVAGFLRETSVTNDLRGVAVYIHKSTGSMLSGFGSSIDFEAWDNTISNYNPLVTLAGGVDLTGVKNSGRLSVQIWKGGARTERLSINADGLTRIGIAGTAARLLHVEGEARITDLTTDTPTRIVGADADGDLGAITVGSGLSLSAGTLSATTTTNIYTADGTLTSNRTLTGGSYNLTFNAKTKIGSDSSFVHDPAQDSTFIKGNIKQNGVIYTQSGTNATRDFSNIFYLKSDGAYSISGTSYAEPGVGKYNWFILNDQRGYAEDGFGIKNENLQYVGGPSSYTTLFTIRNNANLELGYPVVSRMTRVNSDTFAVGANYSIYSDLTNTAFYAVGKTTTQQKTVSLAKFYIGADSTLKFDPANDQLRLSQYGTGTKEAADLSKTQSNYVAGFATDGTVMEVTGLQVQSDQQVIFNAYDNAAPFTPSAASQTPTEFFLSPSTTGKILQRKIRQVTSVTDTDFSSALVTTGLQEAQDYHIWATCSNAASDSVVIDLPTPSGTYQGQMIYVYGNGQNATPNRDVYVRSVTTQLWYGNASPQAEKYYQVTSLGLARNSKTAVFICAYDGSNYFWQLIQTP